MQMKKKKKVESTTDSKQRGRSLSGTRMNFSLALSHPLLLSFFLNSFLTSAAAPGMILERVLYMGN